MRGIPDRVGDDCRFPETYNFKHPTDDIIEISIVELSFGENGKLIETKIRQIADTESFLADFKKIECYMYFGDPLGVTPEGVEDTVIKITYENGEYELINWKGQAEYTSEKGLIYYAGYCVFDEKQFESLLENSGTD